MQTKIIEAIQPGTPQNWGKFIVMRPDSEWKRSAAAPGCEPSDISPEILAMLGWEPEHIAYRSLLAQIGWGSANVIVFDLQTREGAAFHPNGSATYDLNRHRIWVCPLFEPFLEWLYKQPLDDLSALPDHIEVEADFQMAGYRRPGELDDRLRGFTRWLVNPEANIRGMVELLWTNSRVFAVTPAEESGELVLYTDQAGWDLLVQATSVGVTGYVTKTGRVLTENDLDELAAEAERGYDVSHLSEPT